MTGADARSLLDRARRRGAPIVDGERVTFLWRGRRPPLLVGDFTNWELGDPVTLTELAPGVWAHERSFPPDAYLEYAYLGLRGARVRDPLNRRLTPNGVGSYNHYCYMPDAAPTPLARVAAGAARGRVTRHRLPTGGLAVGSSRAVHLYQPPARGPVPLIVVLDGTEYLRRARLPLIVDNLIAAGRIRPVALALVASGGSARVVEYADNDSTLGFLLDRVVPFARERLRLVDPAARPGAFGILGASLGGVTALYAGLREPGGRVLSQSGTFTFRLSAARHSYVPTKREFEPVVVGLVRELPPRPIRVWLDVGAFDYLIASNRRMRDLLVARGYDVSYREYHAGHNFPAWRDDVWRGLEALFGVNPAAGHRSAPASVLSEREVMRT